ncbi:unnamed protein product, partial [Rotaria magnacalcarata]
MENKKSNKRNSALDNFVISSKKLRDENINLNFISNPSSSSSTSTTMNALTCSSPSDNSSTCFIGTDAANLTLNTEYSSPKSSLTTYPTDVSRTSEDPPSQPRLAIYPIDKDNRSFQERWYSNHPWMEYSIKLDSVFCYFCRHFSQGSTPTRIQRDAFTTSGFNTWKRALARNRGGTGGFLQGGSHSLLSSWKGLGVDQVLEYDVVTVDGQRKIVSPCQNSDLFYALSGGVGGTYDVVVSVVLRIFRSPHIIGTLLSIEASNEALYATLIRDFVRFLPKLAEGDW